MALLSEVLIDNLNEKEWQQFILVILKKYLSKPVSYQTSPINEIVSQKNIIDALNKISIPNSEILAYLAFKLDLKIEKDGN